jgi:crotonobetainyl-CoA:carnitine CoA-transferase CaiB-like acyl-CoA transferase
VRLRPDLDAAIAEWVSGKTFAAASAAAEGAKIGWARLNRPTDVLVHPQLVERDRWITTSAPAREFLSLRPAADASGWTWEPGGVPALGEHTEAIRAEFGSA